MPVSPTIDRDNKLPQAEDYSFLRKEAISLIQSLSGEIWTDYNTHDPGITLLEAICYALTDLGYRTSFDIQDIISPQNLNGEAWKKMFYTARNVLPCNPLTLPDYRKLIIDTEGVRNAWIEKSDGYEILIYLQKIESKASVKQRYSLTYDPGKAAEALRLRGLYKVFVEYEKYIQHEKREDEVAGIIRKKLQVHRNLCEDFVSVTSVEYEDFPIEAVIQVNEGTDIDLINARIFKVIYDFFSPPITFYSLEKMLERNVPVDEIFDGPALGYGFIDSKELENSERYKDIHLSDIIRLISGIQGVIAVKKFSFGRNQSPFSEFSEWVNDVKDMQKTPRLDTENSVITFVRSGDRHRVGDNRQSNKERVEAIFLFLQSSDFRSRLKGVSKDLPVPSGEFMEIGDYYPFQRNLPSTYGMSEKYIDDVVDETSIIKAVRELLDQKAGSRLRKVFIRLIEDSGENDHIISAIDDLLVESASVQEVISRLLKDKTSYALMYEILNELFEEKEANISLKDRLQNLMENHHQFTISDKSRNLAKLALTTEKKSLLSITRKKDIHQLKKAYLRFQIEALGKRKQLTLQLRGFLLVFEQIMANHLSQLAHTRELFSFDPSVKQTYFPQVIEGIQDLESLFIDFEKYKSSQLRIIETEDRFIKTRNNILDHLMARFSESMDKYSFFMQNFAGKQAGEKLMDDKIAFLSDYVQISSYRGKAFDYTSQQKSWNSENVEGLKKRICRLLGIRNSTRRTIAPDSIFIRELPLDDDGMVRYVVVLTNPKNKDEVLLESIQYPNVGEARQILKYFLEKGIDSSLYKEERRKDRYKFQLISATDADADPVAESSDFYSYEDKTEAFNKTLETLNSFSEDENFHVIEHILLRPRIGPRAQPTKRRNSAVDSDAVDLLLVRNVPEKVSFSDRKRNEETIRFNITRKKEVKKEIIIWNLSLIEDEEEILVVHEDFTFDRHLTRRIKDIREFGSDVSNYLIDSKDGLWTYKLMGNKKVLAESKRGYRNREELDQEITKLVNFFSYELDSFKGQIEDDNIAYFADPYSLQVSIVLPDWHKRFREPAFRHLLEKTIYFETPSHIHAHIYWLDHEEMREFEEAYKLWVEELSEIGTPDTDIVNKMILALNELRK